MTASERSPGMLANVRLRPSRVRERGDRHRRAKIHREVREASEEQTLRCRRVPRVGYSSDAALRARGAVEDRKEPWWQGRVIYMKTMAIES